MKLHFLAQSGGTKGNGGKKEEDVGLWVKRGREWEWEKWSKGKVVDTYLDVGLTGQPHQVSRLDYDFSKGRTEMLAGREGTAGMMIKGALTSGVVADYLSAARKTGHAKRWPPRSTSSLASRQNRRSSTNVS